MERSLANFRLWMRPCRLPREISSLEKSKLNMPLRIVSLILPDCDLKILSAQSPTLDRSLNSRKYNPNNAVGLSSGSDRVMGVVAGSVSRRKFLEH